MSICQRLFGHSENRKSKTGKSSLEFLSEQLACRYDALKSLSRESARIDSEISRVRIYILKGAVYYKQFLIFISPLAE